MKSVSHRNEKYSFWTTVNNIVVMLWWQTFLKRMKCLKTTIYRNIFWLAIILNKNSYKWITTTTCPQVLSCLWYPPAGIFPHPWHLHPGFLPHHCRGDRQERLSGWGLSSPWHLHTFFLMNKIIRAQDSQDLGLRIQSMRW